MKSERAQMQEEEYAFPYHYLPNRVGSSLSNVRFLRWGWEYACYLHHMGAAVDDLNPGSHLDVGCGDGRLFHVTQSTDRRRAGTDFSLRSLDYARAFNPDVEFHTDLASFGDETFDVVTAVEVLEHIPDDGVDDFLKSLVQRLKPGGHLLISVPSTAIPLHPKHYRHYDGALLGNQVAGACPELELVQYDHIYRRSRLIDLFTRLTLNRFIVLDLAPLRHLLWSYVWRRLRSGGVGHGRHLLGHFQRPASTT
ncbi:MAG: class I SAM-dependent methyltransferase [Gemmatimonadetes bacterium]|jgi:2-polyprenyl-3-methyl-5-hydroxy-6-metoxy-1,4-benzoquinol methylase|nr:class I SAM-dependent methyltransferase [Gemmatimonadota bacterium]MBT6145965.1 class I SAM-dependent methyltransferase [Gemmatimonadota bacterium]MBT7861885.1 class I SAM-dependent methyltransferase [Gemmatimonadota bacterium]